MVMDKARLAAVRLFGQPEMTPDHFLEGKNAGYVRRVFATSPIFSRIKPEQPT
ncbi:unnamed protein product [Dovyalis caffra]|uniref:Uncharacterized protein n=1 Tax=Dovyalis caffra TaxID=77055 RepID=A0AAV1S2Y5_9ROSI|nr:unnamed protein product [Dovyalis caffra]